MNRDWVIAQLKSAEAELRARGVARAALFGSVARGEAKPDTDVDVMVEIAPELDRLLDLSDNLDHAMEDLIPSACRCCGLQDA